MKKWNCEILGIMAVAALVCLLNIGRAGAWNQDELDRLRETNACSGCDLSGALLYGEDLSGANLTNTNLIWATWTDGRQCAEGSIGECK